MDFSKTAKRARSAQHTHGAILCTNKRSKKASREFIDTEVVEGEVDGLVDGEGEIMLAIPAGKMADTA